MTPPARFPVFPALAALALALALPAAGACADDPAPQAVPQAARPHPCRVEGVGGEVLCATLPVWEDRAAKAGRQIGLNIVVLPALGPDLAPDPVFYLAGGPGQPATTQAAGFAGFTPLRQRRALVFVDQRGTGGSNGLDCRFYGEPLDVKKAAGDFLPEADVRRCRDELSRRADLRLYTTAMAMDDLDDVRAWLGYDKINLVGGSYGTQAAQVYLRRHGDRVRTAVLDGVAPVDELNPLHHARAGQRAIELLFRECAADPACRAAFPDPAGELAAVMAKVDQGTKVRVRHPKTSETVEVAPTRGLVAEGIRFYMYWQEDGGVNTLPLRIHRAAEGDLAPLVETAIDRRLELDDILYNGMWLSVTCAESVAFIDPAIIPRETAGTFLGDARVRAQRRACELWPRGEVPPDVRELVRSEVPVLLLSGERDPVTPPEFAERVASGLPNSLHLVVPHGGHGSSNPCTDRILVDFLESGTAKGLDTACVRDNPPAKFATRLEEADAADAAAAAPPGPQEVKPHPCRVEGVKEEVRCATLPVWEDRAAKQGRRIGLNIVILPALGSEKAPAPIFYLAGGPGGAATDSADGLAQFAELRRRHDVVLVDQRGTGGSNRLDCPFYGDPENPGRLAAGQFPEEEVRRCRERLSKVANLGLYTTAIAMDDLDEVRAWLGYEKVNLFGGSYGTTAAQVYLRRHGDRVRTAVLDGVGPVDTLNPLDHARAGQRALDLLLAECAADAECHAAFPDPAGELRAVMAKIDQGVQVKVREPATGKTVEVRPSRGLVGEGIRFFMYAEQEGKNTLPLQIHRAYQGDLAPLVETALGQRLRLDRGLDYGLLLSVTCAETLRFVDIAAIPRATAGTFLGDARVREQRRACDFWPRGEVPPDVHELVRSDVPVLLFSGERDPVTPPEFGERVAARLPNSLHVVTPHGGHGSGGPCAERILVEFLDRGSAKGIDTACIRDNPPAKFATRFEPEKKETGR